jgi:hypothetical protein
MNKFFIFSDDDFAEVESATLDGMQTGNLIESLQGTLIGLHTIQEVTDRVNLVDMGPYTQFKKCSMYDGFLGIIHQWRCGSFDLDFIKKNIGIYRFKIVGGYNVYFDKVGINKKLYNNIW